jgi:hypothetical protein
MPNARECSREDVNDPPNVRTCENNQRPRSWERRRPRLPVPNVIKWITSTTCFANSCAPDQCSARRGQAGTPALPGPRSLIIFTASAVWGIQLKVDLLPYSSRGKALSNRHLTISNPNALECKTQAAWRLTVQGYTSDRAVDSAVACHKFPTQKSSNRDVHR